MRRAADLPAPGLVAEVLQEQRAHRALEADVEFGHLALGQRDDADAREAQPLVAALPALHLPAARVPVGARARVRSDDRVGRKPRRHLIHDVSRIYRRRVGDGARLQHLALLVYARGDAVLPVAILLVVQERQEHTPSLTRVALKIDLDRVAQAQHLATISICIARARPSVGRNSAHGKRVPIISSVSQPPISLVEGLVPSSPIAPVTKGKSSDSACLPSSTFATPALNLKHHDRHAAVRRDAVSEVLARTLCEVDRDPLSAGLGEETLRQLGRQNRQPYRLADQTGGALGEARTEGVALTEAVFSVSTRRSQSAPCWVSEIVDPRQWRSKVPAAPLSPMPIAWPGVSIGVQKGPPIGVQKGPPLSSGVTGMAGVPFALVAA